MERVPGQRCALDAHRELVNAGKDRELAQVHLFARRRLACHKLMELSEKRLGFRPRLALDALSHERCRGGGDGTALTLEADVLDHIALEIDMKREAVAAERVIAFGFPMRA